MNLSPKRVKFLKTFLKPQVIASSLSTTAGLFLLLSAYLTYQNIQKTLKIGLTLQAQSIEVILQSLIKNFDLSLILHRRDFFLDLLLNEKWEGVAFITLYDENKNILLHTNLDLIGQKIDYSPYLERGEKVSFLTLKTGEPVFLYENKIQLKNSTGILRIALHIYPVQTSLYFANLHFYTEIFFALLFILLGFFSYIVLNKLNQTRDKIEELERWQRITQILIHEIKNPLASIKGFTQYLNKKIFDEKLNNALETILRESLRLERLIGSLTQFSHPFENKLKKIELISLINEVLMTLQYLFPESIIVFNTEIREAWITSDGDKLKSIIINLLENAINANQEMKKKEVFVTLNFDGNYYILNIKDQGPGIEPSIKEQIFEPFFTTKSRGMGLGLTIVRRFCDDLKLDFGLESQLNKGTVAWLKIPK